MKKITLLILAFFLALSGFAQSLTQQTEGFEGSTLPDLDSDTWQLETGIWGVFDNGVATDVSWNVNESATFVYQGDRSAYMNRDTNIGQFLTHQDFLATPAVTVPADGRLLFYTRTTIPSDQGTKYKLMFAPADANQNDPEAYNLVREWSETTLTVNYDIYEEISVDLSAFAGQNVYFAFVMEYEQLNAAATEDRWLIDNVRIVAQCATPTGLTAGTFTQSSASLNWANPSSSTSWEIEIVPVNSDFTNNGIVITDKPYIATRTTTPNAPLEAGTTYKYQIRSICAGDVRSDWSGFIEFTTATRGLTCAAPIPVILTNGLYNTTNTTLNFGDTTDVSQGTGCGITGNYMAGNDVFYSYTPTVSGAITVTMTPTGDFSGIFVYAGCPNVGVACVAGVANTGNAPRIIPSLPVTAGVEYIFVISTNSSRQSVQYNLIIQTLNCAPPTGLAGLGTGVDETDPSNPIFAADLSWANPSASSEWEVFVQTPGGVIPATAGQTATTNEGFEVTTLTNGAPLGFGVYQFWVRAKCADGDNDPTNDTFSPWSGPQLFNTLGCNTGCGYVFTMTDSNSNTWNGNTMDIRQNGVVVGTLTGPPSGQASSTQTVSLCDGPFELYWNSGGSSAGQVGVSIANTFGQTLYTKNAGTGAQATVLYSGAVDCVNPVCFPPTNLTVALPTTTGANLNWTQNGTIVPESWDIFVVQTGVGTPPTADSVPYVTIPGDEPRPYTITGLLADTNYTYYVRAVCTTPGANPWSVVSPPFTTLATCPKPTALLLVSAAQESAVIRWTNGLNETNWEVLVLDANAPPPTATTLGWVPAPTGQPFTVENLEPSTPYNIYVRAVCSESDKSTWTGPLAVTTTQVPGTLPFVEGFEDASANQWTLVNGSQVNKWIVGTATNNGGTHALYVTNDNGVTNAYSNGTATVTHAYRDITIPNGATDVNLSFDWRVDGEGETTEYDWVRVWRVPTTYTPVAGTVIDNTNGRVALTPQLNEQPTYITSNYVIPAAAFAGSTIRLAFEWRNDGSGGQNPPGAIDNINIKVITCYAPSAIVTGIVGQTTANLSWTAPTAGASSYDYYLSTTNTAPTDTTEPTNNVSGTTLALDTLQSSTTYYFWVRSNCGENGTSTWTGPASFTTTQVPAELPLVEGFEEEVQWSFVNGSQVNKWVVGTATNNGGTHALYVTNDNGVSNTYTNSTLSVTHAYRDITIPQNVNEINLSFDWRADGEGVTTEYDWVRVWRVPTTYIPTPGTVIDNANGRVAISPQLNEEPNYITANYIIPAAPLAGTTIRLVFEWRNDGSGGQNPPGAIDNINLKVLTCPRPTTLTATEITETSALIGWTEVGDATEWEVVLVDTGSPVPGPNPAGVFSALRNPLYVTGLLSGHSYTYYVRSICSADDKSNWSEGLTFKTLPANDNCGGAIFVPVNSGGNCLQSVDGTIYGATPSDVPNTCGGNADDDVWFKFVASNSYLNITLSNLQPATNLRHALYSGTCDGLTLLYCGVNDQLNSVANNLTVGQVYYIRVYSQAATPLTTSFNLCITTPSTCSNSPTVCNTTYPNTVGVTSIGSPGCLGGAPNPSFFTIQISGSGPINYTLAQSSLTNPPGAAPDQDVDYAAWGPFSSQQEICNIIAAGGEPLTGLTTGCSFSTAAVEYFNIPNAQEGQFYVILITNWDDDEPGTISLTQTNAGAPGAGETSCCPDAYIQYQNTYCKGQDANPTPQILTGSLRGSFSASPEGIVFVDVNTGEIDLNASTPGDYVITNTLAVTETCGVKSAFYTITITAPAVATISYETQVYCTGDTDTYTVTFAGDLGGSYSAFPQGLYVNPTTGTISPNLSAPGSYLVYYNSTAGGACTAASPNTPVQIIANPVITDVADFSNCGPYTLPALTVGNYFTGPGGTGESIAAGSEVISTQTIYIYTVDGICSDEDSFLLTIDEPIVVPDPDDVFTCGPYTLLPLTIGNYYTATNGGGTLLNAGDVIPSTQTVYVYAVSANCPAVEQSFEVNIGPLTATAPADQQECGSYTLPELTNGNYYTASGGLGDQLSAGDPITSTQTIYVYVTSGTCPPAEDSFLITITPFPPVTENQDVEVCGSYTLPVIANGNYFTLSDGLGTPLFAGNEITTSQQIYIYTIDGVCPSQTNFSVTITSPPVLPTIAPVTQCEPYILPPLALGNYYTGAGGTGQMLPVGTPITTSQTVYVYLAGSTPICTVETSFAVAIAGGPQFTITGVCDGVFTLTANPINGSFDPATATYLWSAGTGGSIIGSTTGQSVKVSGRADYNVVVTSNGCPNTEVFPADEVVTCDIQKGISANGDDVNDSFDLTGQDVSELQIFNRYGTIVYKKKNYVNEWFGQTDKGEELPDGTYYYVMERRNASTITGWIYINRAQN